jgi:hypothetical protein
LHEEVLSLSLGGKRFPDEGGKRAICRKGEIVKALIIIIAVVVFSFSSSTITRFAFGA